VLVRILFLFVSSLDIALVDDSECLVRIGGITDKPVRPGFAIIDHFCQLAFLSTIEMRNIALSGTWRSVIQDGNITITAVDVDRACIWIASERSNADADIEMDVYKRGLPDDSYEMDQVRARLEKPGKRIGPRDSLPLQVAPTELVATLVSSANRTVPDTVSQVASLRSVPGEESLVVITRGGDIASMKLEDPDSQAR
jgi:hypothetical protein